MRRTIKVNNEVLKRMRKMYYPEGSNYIDWMGFKITEENKPSYHHIEKAEDLRKEDKNDEATIENGAYLGKKSHELLHRIEIYDKDLYDSWNYLFRVINNMKCYPIDDVWESVYDLKIQSIKYSHKNSLKL